MVTAELSFQVDHDVADDTVVDVLWQWLSALRMNGQICGREYPIAYEANRYRTYVLLPVADSLELMHGNRYVRRGWDALSTLGARGVTTCIVGEDPQSAVPCHCPSAVYHILYTNFLTLESPLRCGTCFGPIPLYRIPPPADDEYHDVVSWQSNYQACDALQMNCRVLERSTTRQLSHVASQLSRDGRTICATIEGLTGVPTYYYLYRSGSRSRKQELKRRCPSCGEAWLQQAPLHGLFDFRCDTCRLLSNIAWDAQ